MPDGTRRHDTLWIRCIFLLRFGGAGHPDLRGLYPSHFGCTWISFFFFYGLWLVTAWINSDIHSNEQYRKHGMKTKVRLLARAVVYGEWSPTPVSPLLPMTMNSLGVSYKKPPIANKQKTTLNTLSELYPNNHAHPQA